MSAQLFKIEDGVFGLSLVDTAEIGYLPEWQTPGGVDIATIALADYEAGSTPTFSCQVVTGVLTATENVTSESVDGTWCADGLPQSRQIVGEDTFSVDWDIYQDPHVADGLTSYLYENRGKKAYLYFGAGGDQVPPVAVGVVTLKASSIGGGRSYARATVSFPFDRAPDIQFGNLTAWHVVYGDKNKPPVDGPTP